ncbi:phospholipase A2 inhibitor and Ly6/PLAUR domain-containing protein-like [Emydura macquarii macquarii]|uniref:phospholipase A2 inhibitor and Ly6/PLAUR domain-containing protein-like n=1 Tax=Emydura macquarii macquarii TaxID=1129001 RepID=UPI00352A7893
MEFVFWLSFSPCLHKSSGRRICSEIPAPIHTRPITMKTPLVLCILSALLGLGACLQCEVCIGVDKCMGNMETCPSGKDSCGISVLEGVIVGMNIQGVIKSCVASSECRASPDVMRFGNGITIRKSTTCCVGDACSTASATMPPANRTPNGLRCPVCSSVFNIPCSKETLDCTGDETQCITLVGHTILDTVPLQTTLKGCATESVCTHLQVDSKNFGEIAAQITKATCTPARGRSRPTKGPDPGASGTAKGPTTGAVGLTKGPAPHAAGMTLGPPRLLLLPVLTGLFLVKCLF